MLRPGGGSRFTRGVMMSFDFARFFEGAALASS